MNGKNSYVSWIAFLFLSFFWTYAFGQSLVNGVQFSSEEAKVQLEGTTPNSYFVEIGGPNDYYWKQKVEFTNEISLSNVKTNGEKFKDGLYSLQITPIFELTERQRADLMHLREVNDQEAIAAYRIKHNLPAMVENFSMNFSIRNGQFVIADQVEGKLNLPTMSSKWELDHPSLYASVNTVGLEYPDHAMDNSSLVVDQQFLDDVIVVGSICVGQDCVNGENFGFDTQRLKENNLRIHFNDTSSSASFPTSDWRIVINDSSNGGANYFAIEDSDSGTVPFRVLKGAGNNALYIDAQGDVGLNTSNPIVELHIADGDTPTMRLEQNGSSGFTAQTWDVAGNETNFFIRDATNGSKLPFKIRPSAPDNSIYIDTDGDVGFRTSSPDGQIDVAHSSNASNHAFLISPTSSVGINIDNGFTPNGLFDVQTTGGESRFMVNNDGDVGIGTTMPESKLDVNGGAIIRSGDLLMGQTAGAGDSRIEIGYQRTMDGHAYFDMIADAAAFPDFGLRVIRFPSGISRFDHRGSNPLQFNANDANGFIQLQTNGTERIRINSDGKIGIGTVASTDLLEVNGTASKPGGGDWAMLSDSRLKKNIKPFTDGLAAIMAINPVTYQYNGTAGIKDTDTEYVGVIAQELQKIAPYMVESKTIVEMGSKGTDATYEEFVKSKEDYLGVDATAIRYMLVNAVKEQQAIIDAQQAEINNLKSELTSLQELKAQVAQLTQMVMSQNGGGKSKTQADKK